MSYITYSEYKNMGFSKITNEEKFKELESTAEVLFNAVTNQYYIRHPIESDVDTIRVNLFKRALCLQCEYANDLNASTPYELNALGQINSVSIGRTHIQTNSNAENTNYGTSGIYGLAFTLLTQAGLVKRRVYHT
nr:hypothetical protein [uncultured Ligilactobacillus sp.]